MGKKPDKRRLQKFLASILGHLPEYRAVIADGMCRTEVLIGDSVYGSVTEKGASQNRELAVLALCYRLNKNMGSLPKHVGPKPIWKDVLERRLKHKKLLYRVVSIHFPEAGEPNFFFEVAVFDRDTELGRGRDARRLFAEHAAAKDVIDRMEQRVLTLQSVVRLVADSSEEPRVGLVSEEPVSRKQAIAEIRSTIGQLGAERGLVTEERVLESIGSCAQKPTWFVSIEKASADFDRYKGIDFVVHTTDVGDLFLEIKSSQSGVQKHFTEHQERLRVIVLCINYTWSDEEIARFIFFRLRLIREKLLA